MTFRLFGFPTHVQFGFWLIALFLGQSALEGPHKYLIVVWIAVVFVSILAHELGHAFAMRRHGMEPEITLHMMGGLTAAHGMARLSRPQRIFVSFAGPLAGFTLAALVWLLVSFVPALGALPSRDAGPAAVSLFYALESLWQVNLFWGIFNLIPVLPLDGGHILEDALGARRQKLSATISMAIGGAVVLWSLAQDPPQWWIGLIFGMAAFHSYQRYRAASETSPTPKAVPKAPSEAPLPPEIEAQLRQATEALADERYDEAGTLAELVLGEGPPKHGRIRATEIIAWAHLLEGRLTEAARAIRAIQRDGAPDAALVGSLLFNTGEHDQARQVLETARAAGDDRKEVVGPLIQILIGAGQIARAAAIALDIVETLSDEDVRQMGRIAHEHSAYVWSARLAEALFERTGSPDDAYDAVRGRALEGDLAAAFILLRRAVAAGFSDAARVWSDADLETLRHEGESELEELLPRPSAAD